MPVPDGYTVDLDVLDRTAQAISQTMHDMKTCEVDDIVGSPKMYGHADLREAVDDFCERWQGGVEILIEDGVKLAKALNSSVDAYIDADNAAERSMRAIGGGNDPARDVADG